MPMINRILPLTGMCVAALAGWQLIRWRAEEKQTRAAWEQLTSTAGPAQGRFDPAMVADLPEPARRFFLFAIEPGARLDSVVEITMRGELSLGTKEKPQYQPMQAEQLLAPPHGLVWRVRTGSGFMRAEGSDGMVGDRSWTRFRILGLVPIVRAGGDADHLRSSFGRLVGEAAFWAPASLLPGAGVAWTALDADTARAVVAHRGMRQQIDIRVNAGGQPLWVSMPRWSNANPQGVYREQPFGGEVSDFRCVQGFRVPFRVDGGNFFGTSGYFPFCRARLLTFRLL
ncbi:hypothetical protein H4CHR_03899 [Variovorax sp. PBS-H4]|uniref:DUF6544 family protein n=1 Tax=Variovorax sp. PBS-H4 TaxID=434008 RepID=UPI00131864EF|nr:DUF6544 family protein [Variovorax sp. PBS-H4]VTU36381.1 hypothetical protein H4CHR_03899 [Variovorax sp. PBS-H4]